MKEELANAIATAAKDLFGLEVNCELARTNEQFGDFATNVAMQLAPLMHKSPLAVAQQLVPVVQELEAVDTATVAGPGFINLKLTNQALWQLAQVELAKPLAGQVVVAEYSDPNPFKVLHAGHLYTSVVGDAIANLLQNAGAQVHRVNFGGDVGLHVAKTMWAILKDLGGEYPDKLVKLAPHDFADWSSKRYIEGNEAYESNEQAKPEITELNKKIYQIHETGDHDSPLAQIYWTCRSWSYDYFNWFYDLIGSKFERFYPESQTAPIGLKTVREQTGKVYEESNGAVVFKGEKYGLHTRVFINAKGLPTYEAKDVGLIMAKWQDYHFDRSIVITGNDIEQYMQVVLKSVEQFEPDLVKSTRHLTHGQVKLPGGVKMSSRLGNIIPAVAILDLAAAASQELIGTNSPTTILGAVKYAFLKQRLGSDIIYDPSESVSLAGNSGPYLQYAHARAASILAKASQAGAAQNDLDEAERSLLRKIGEYREILTKSLAELMPHHICTYLYELAQGFNSFYETSRIVGSDRETVRLKLVELYIQTLKNGLQILGIEAPEQV